MTWAMVFPGQGSQSVGMMTAYEGLPVVRETFDEASAILGQDLWQLATDGSQEQLNLTTNTQPLMLTAGMAVYRAWRALGGGVPAFAAGHSLGEYSALTAAGSLAFDDALRLVRLRATAMQEAVPAGVGAMAAIMGLDGQALAEACAEASSGEIVAPANFNAVGQTVIAGHAGAVERAIAAAKARGAKRAVLLPVSAPFHCALMRPAAERLAAALADTEIRPPAVPVVHNADVALHASPTEIRSLLVEQAYSPVRWVETVQWLAQRGVTKTIECGPGKVLSGLTKRIVAGMEGLSLHDRPALEATLTALETV